jgi:replicative DNA helicase
MTDYIPPHDLNAEVAVLGGCLAVGRAVRVLRSDVLRPEHFYREAHRLVFEAVRDVLARGRQGA